VCNALSCATALRRKPRHPTAGADTHACCCRQVRAERAVRVFDTQTCQWGRAAGGALLHWEGASGMQRHWRADTPPTMQRP
jgi:hypothetical protein